MFLAALNPGGNQGKISAEMRHQDRPEGFPLELNGSKWRGTFYWRHRMEGDLSSDEWALRGGKDRPATVTSCCSARGVSG